MNLVEFIRESNRIEGIRRDPAPEEIGAHKHFLELDHLSLNELCFFVGAIAGIDAKLRERPGMDVRVGRHIPPAGGPGVRSRLEALLADVDKHDPYSVHVEYETLHPFMDGNGRSGRAIWAWMIQRGGEDPFALPFLHRWYYQSLDAGRGFE